MVSCVIAFCNLGLHIAATVALFFILFFISLRPYWAAHLPCLPSRCSTWQHCQELYRHHYYRYDLVLLYFINRYHSCCCLGGDILEGMPPGQVKAARQMLQNLHVSIVTNAMVSSMHHANQSRHQAHQSRLFGCHHKVASLGRPGQSLRMSVWVYVDLRLSASAGFCQYGHG